MGRSCATGGSRIVPRGNDILGGRSCQLVQDLTERCGRRRVIGQSGCMPNPKKQLCIDLMHADTEAEVIQLLRALGHWDNAGAWRYLGDQEFNYSSVGNQQSKAEQANIEKLIYSIDAKLMLAECLFSGRLGAVRRIDEQNAVFRSP